MKIAVNFSKFSRLIADNICEVKKMIKNISMNSNMVSNSYSSQKTDKVELNKTDSSVSGTNTKPNPSLSANKVDTIEISYRPVMDSSTITDVKNMIVNDVNKDAEVQHLKTFKSQVDQGQYKVDVEELSRIMLDNE